MKKSINHYTFLHLIDKNDRTVKLDSYLNDAKLEISETPETTGKIENGKIRFSQSGGTWQFYLPEEEKRARYDMAIQFARNPRAAKILAMDLQIITNEKGELRFLIEIKTHESGQDAAKTLKAMGKEFADPLTPEIAEIINPIMDYISIIEPRLEKAGAKYTDMDLDADFWTLTNEIKSAIESIYNLLAEKMLHDIYAAPPIQHALNLKTNSISHITTQQLKIVTDPTNKPNKNGVFHKPVKDNINRVKTSGSITIHYPVEQGETPPDVLLFEFPETGRAYRYLTPFHRRVYQAVSTLIDAYRNKHPEVTLRGGKIKLSVTNRQIAYAMGFTSLSEKLNNMINQAMFDMAAIQLEQDWNEEIKARHIDVKEAVDIYGHDVFYNETSQYLLQANKIRIIPQHAKTDKNGEKITVEGWLITAIPPLYAQAKLTGQIISLPLDVFNIKAFKRMTPERNSLIQELAARIYDMKYHAENGRGDVSNYQVISIDKLFKNCGIKIKNPQQKRYFKQDIEIILTAFRDDFKMFSGFKYLPETGHVTSIKIDL